MPLRGVYGCRQKDDFKTPTKFYQDLNKKYDFDFDPCPFQSDFDGILKEWGERNFVNPPFSNIVSFFEKAVEEMKKGKLSVFLVPIRSNSNYWRDLVFPNATDFTFVKGISFEPHTRCIPIPLCLIEFDPKKNVYFESSKIGDTIVWQ